MTTTPPTPPSQPTFGAVPPFAPRPQPSALSATPILNQPIDAEEPHPVRHFYFQPRIEVDLTVGPNRLWRERQDEEIGTRDVRSKTRRQTNSKAEQWDISSIRINHILRLGFNYTTWAYSILSLYLY
jgi:hypothetical protein